MDNLQGGIDRNSIPSRTLLHKNGFVLSGWERSQGSDPCGSEFIRETSLQSIEMCRLHLPFANKFAPTEAPQVSSGQKQTGV